MNKKWLSQKILNYAKRFKAIEYKGGKCKICGNDKWYHMEFHHIKDKKHLISDLLNQGYRWSLLKKELDKCEMYCSNCHQEKHFVERQSDDDRQVTKQIYLEYKGNKCEECGYDKCQASLTFHHLDPNEKELQFSNLWERINSLDELKENLITELDKCQLLCCNCHREKHAGIEFYNEYKELIMEKKENMIEKNKADEKLIMEMYNSGMKQVDIRKKLGIPKSTLSDVIKRNK